MKIPLVPCIVENEKKNGISQDNNRMVSKQLSGREDCHCTIHLKLAHLNNVDPDAFQKA